MTARVRPGGLRWWVLAVLAASVAACSEPSLPEPAREQTDAPDVPADDVLDPSREALVDAVRLLAGTVTTAREALDAAAAAERDTEARTSVATALAGLLDGAGETTTPGLFPSVTSERSGASGTQDDLLTATLAVAREAGGELGRATVETLRDPLAGDLGAWERDAAGMVAAIEATVAGARDVDAATAAVMELPGDGARALAWTTLADETTDPELRRAAAERASSHLTVVEVALSLLDDPGAAT